MATRDILVLNTTQSRAETQQGSDTVRLKGTGEILSIENSSASPILSIKSDDSQTILEGKITSTGNLTGVSSASFGKVEATTLVGSAAFITNTDKLGTLSSSAQIASKVSGSFRAGFEFTGTISGSGGSTGSFDKITAKTFAGDASNLNNSQINNTLSSSAQIASDISGSFNKGFEFTGTIKAPLGVWSAGGALIAARTQDGGVGTKAAFIQVDSSRKTEIYDGSSWSECNDMINGLVQQEAAGSSTSALVFGGYVPANMADSEEWNGTNWATQTAMPISRSNHAAAGQTDADSALVFGGGSNAPIAPPSALDTVEWNGSSWTTHGSTDLMPYFRNGVGFGSTEAAIYSNHTSFNKEWNGTAWSSISNTTLEHTQGSGGGTVNDGLVFAGSGGGANAATELYDGTAWTAQGALSTGRNYLDGGGTGTGNALAVGGAPGLTSVEEFTTYATTGSFGRIETTTITGDGYELTNYIKEGTVSGSAQIAADVSASFNKGFNFDGEISASESSSLSVSTLTAHTLVGEGSALTNTIPTDAISGSAQIAADISGSFNKGFEFTGEVKTALGSWSSGGALSTGTTYHTVLGDKSGAISAFGATQSWPQGTINNTSTQKYNGDTWSEANDTGTARYTGTGAGISVDAGIFFGGNTPGGYGGSYVTRKTEEYNGTNFSEVADLIIGRKHLAGSGNSEAALAIAGNLDNAPTNPSGTANMGCNMETFNGTNWSNVGQLPVGLCRHAASGTTNATVVYGQQSLSTETYEWNGTNWSEGGAHPNRCQVAGGGSVNNAISFGGFTGEPQRTCETATYDGTGWSLSGNLINKISDSGEGANQLAAGTALSSGGATGTNYIGVTCTEEFTTSISSGSFGKVLATNFVGVGSNITNIPIPSGVVSSSAQLASNISASFTSGFEFVGSISGSAQSTGSFTHLKATTFSAGVTELTNTALDGTVSGSGNLAADISGAFASGFRFIGCMQGSHGAWSEDAALSTARCYASSVGTKAGALYIGGGKYPTANYCTLTEEYNGSSWSEINDLIKCRTKGNSVGTTESVAYFGGENAHPNWVATCTETFNGTNWSEEADMNSGIKRAGVAGGSSENAMHFGGDYATSWSHFTNWAECFNGTSWSEMATLNCARSNLAGLGTTEAALAIAGNPTPGGHSPGNAFDVEQWNGVNWNHIGCTLLNPSLHSSIKGSGTVNDALAFGGYHYYPTNPSTVLTGRSQHYDGTSWTFGASLLTGRTDLGGDGLTSGDAIAAGGRNPGAVTCTEIYTETNTTASFGHLEVRELIGEACTLDNIIPVAGLPLRVSSSKQIAEDICGSFDKGFEFTGEIRNAKGKWSTIASLNTGRTNPFVAGTQNSSLVVGGGFTPGSPYYTDNSEEFDGTSWTEGNNLITAGRQGHASAGTQNAAVFAGGYIHPAAVTCTEEYNGTSYATGGVLNVARWNGFGAGTQTSALSVGGRTPSVSDTTELYDGSAFSQLAVNIGGTSNERSGDGASSNNALAIGDYPATTNVRQWDGMTWFGVADTVEDDTNRAATGTTTDFIAYGGTNSIDGTVSPTEEFDGTSWSKGGDYLIAMSRGEAGSIGGGSSAWGVGGDRGSTNHAVDAFHYNSYHTTGSFGKIETPDVQIAGNSQLVVKCSLGIPVYATNAGIVSSSAGQVWFTTDTNKLNFTMDVNSWSAGANLITTRGYNGGAGTQNAAITTGGNGPSAVTDATEQYNGSAWSFSEGHDLILARNQVVMTGTQNSALLFGGQVSPAVKGETESFNGTAWSEKSDLNKTRRLHYGFGTQNAAVAASGRTSTPASAIIADTEEWNGSTWTAAADINDAKGFAAAAGTQNAGIIFGGSEAHSTSNATGQTETYDGTAWTERNDMVNARLSMGGGGTQNAAIAHGGSRSDSPYAVTCTEEWNGTSWSVVNVLPEIKRTHGHAGDQSSTLAIGGIAADYTNTNYEYSVSHLKTVEIDGV